MEHRRVYSAYAIALRTLQLRDNLFFGVPQEVRSYEEATKMRYVTSIERLAKEEGILENAPESVIEVLATRFGEVPSGIIDAINGIDELSMLKNLLRRAISVGSVVKFQQVLQEITS